MTRRIGGKGGGSDKGSSGSVAIVLGLVVAVGAGGATMVGSALSSGGASVSASSGAAGSGTRVGSRNSSAAEIRIAKQGVRIAVKVTDDSADCVGHSYGQVQEFFRRNPCVALHRAFFEVRDAKGDAAIVAVAWVEMPDESRARALKKLMDSGATGNVTELSRERGKYRSVRYTGDAYASRIDGVIVSNAQAEPVVRGWTGLALTTIATNAAQ